MTTIQDVSFPDLQDALRRYRASLSDNTAAMIGEFGSVRYALERSELNHHGRAWNLLAERDLIKRAIGDVECEIEARQIRNEQQSATAEIIGIEA